MTKPDRPKVYTQVSEEVWRDQEYRMPQTCRKQLKYCNFTRVNGSHDIV